MDADFACHVFYSCCHDSIANAKCSNKTVFIDCCDIRIRRCPLNFAYVRENRGKKLYLHVAKERNGCNRRFIIGQRIRL